MSDDIKTAAEWIASAEHILITAGAGMGVDSGLPSFRDVGGFWQTHPCYKEEGLNFSDLARPDWFENDIARAWGFYAYRLQLYANTEPHEGFHILRKWCENKDHFIFTSNVDGHFQKAGFSENSINECHGNINYFQCCAPEQCCYDIWMPKSINLVVDSVTMVARGEYPRCPHCDAAARPNILMFGDRAWVRDKHEEQALYYRDWFQGLNREKLVVIEIGAGMSIPTVRMESQGQGGRFIRINPSAYSAEGLLHINEGAKAALRAINSYL